MTTTLHPHAHPALRRILIPVCTALVAFVLVTGMVGTAHASEYAAPVTGESGITTSPDGSVASSVWSGPDALHSPAPAADDAAPAAGDSDELPFTGAVTTGIGGLGVALIVLGIGLRWRTRSTESP